MNEEAEVALEATSEAVAEDQVTSEATENTEGQDTPPAADEAEKKTAAQERRERRKAREQRLIDEAATARREAEQLRSRMARIEAVSSGEAPKEADYPDTFEYVAAQSAYRAHQMGVRSNTAMLEEDARAAEARAQAAEQQRMEALQRDYNDQLAESRSRYADIDVAIAVASNPQIVSPQLSVMVLESEAPVDLAYHLGKNPELARQLSAMHPIAAARELGRLEASLSRPQAKTQTSAPPPISPVKGTGTATKNPDDMTAAEWRAWREAGGKL